MVVVTVAVGVVEVGVAVGGEAVVAVVAVTPAVVAVVTPAVVAVVLVVVGVAVGEEVLVVLVCSDFKDDAASSNASNFLVLLENSPDI